MIVLEVSHAARPPGALLVVVDSLPPGIANGRKVMSLGGVWRIYNVDDQYRQLIIMGGEGIITRERLELLPHG
jgi:hypothetical protein